MSTIMNIPLILNYVHDETIERMTREEADYNVSSFKRKKKSYRHIM